MPARGPGSGSAGPVTVSARPAGRPGPAQARWAVSGAGATVGGAVTAMPSRCIVGALPLPSLEEADRPQSLARRAFWMKYRRLPRQCHNHGIMNVTVLLVTPAGCQCCGAAWAGLRPSESPRPDYIGSRPHALAPWGIAQAIAHRDSKVYPRTRRLSVL